eukprot:COSAG06_NODE_2052_length_7728_cov_4.261992_11_plen_129_part_00
MQTPIAVAVVLDRVAIGVIESDDLALLPLNRRAADSNRNTFRHVQTEVHHPARQNFAELYCPEPVLANSSCILPFLCETIACYMKTVSDDNLRWVLPPKVPFATVRPQLHTRLQPIHTYRTKICFLIR